MPLPAAELAAARDIAISERLNRIYITRLTPALGPEPIHRTVDVYNGATNGFLRSFEVKNSGILAVDDTRRHIYFSGFRSTGSFSGIPFLDVYDQDTEAFVTSIDTKVRSINFGSLALAVNPVTGLIYMSTSGHGVSVFDGNSLTLVKDLVDTGSTFPSFIGVNSKTNKIYAVGLSRVAVIYGLTNTAAASFAAGGNHSTAGTGLTGIAVDEEADTINLTDKAWNGRNFFSRLLTFKGQGNHSLLGAVKVRDPRAGPTFNPATRQFLVPDVRRGTIKVIQAGDAAP